MDVNEHETTLHYTYTKIKEKEQFYIYLTLQGFNTELK